MPSIGSMPAFAEKRREVRMVRMPQRSIAACHRLGAGGEIQVDRHLAGERRADVGQRAADRRRAAAGRRAISSAVVRRIQRDEQQAADQRASEASAAAPVESAMQNDHQLMLRRPHELAAERLRWPGAGRIASVGAQRHASPAALRAAVVVDGSGAPNATVTGYGNAHGPFPEEASALEAEDAAPDAIEIDRDDRDVEAVDDPLEAALERQQVAGAADRALGEDADDVAVASAPGARRSSDADAPRGPRRSESPSSASAASEAPSARSTAGRPGSG